MPSAATGQLLGYYTPAFLPDLIDQCRCSGADNSLPKDDDATALLLVQCIARNRDLSVDVAQAKRLFDSITSPRKFGTVEDFEEIGKSISKRVIGFRSEIVFAGGRNAGDANHVFAPHAAIPGLINSLKSALNEDHLPLHPVTYVALVGYFCVLVHPFVDGNGRWSRLITVSAGVKHGHALHGALGAAFQTVSAAELTNEVWIRARTDGLRRYLEFAHQFNAQVRSSLRWIEVAEIFCAVDREIRRLARTNSGYRAIAGDLYTRSSLSSAAIKERAGVSQRVVDGFIEAIVQRTNGLVRVDRGDIALDPLFDEATDIIRQTKEKVFNQEDGKKWN